MNVLQKEKNCYIQLYSYERKELSMKSMSKRYVIALLCLLLTMPLLLASCEITGEESNNSTDAASEESSSNNAHGGKDSNGKYYVNMPENPAPDIKEFRVLVTSNEVETTYFSEEVGVDKYETTDDALEDAVRNRNNKVFGDYGVEIKAIYAKSVLEDVRLDVMSTIGGFDAAIPFLPGCATLAQEGSLYDLADEQFAPYIDLSMPWWDQNATESLSIADKVYFTTGDISIMQKIVSVAITFNKEMLASNWPEVDLYELVRNGEWTLDKMIELSKAVTVDDGDGVYTSKDQWGLSSSYTDSIMFYLASGEKLITKDNADIPQIAIGSERSFTVAVDILTDLQKTGEWCIHCQDFNLPEGGDMWKESLNIFGENRALFRTSAFSAIKKLRNYPKGADYGVVPMPKYDTNQQDYFTPCSAGLANGIVIPISVPKPEFSAFMIEVMACEAKNYSTYAYYTTVLKTRDMDSAEDEEMLDDYVFNNVVYDLGIIYNFGKVSTMFYNLMSTKSTSIASELERIKSIIETDIEEVVLGYQD